MGTRLCLLLQTVIWSDKTLHIHDNPDNTTLSLYITPHRLSSHSGQTIWLLHPGTSLPPNYTLSVIFYRCNMGTRLCLLLQTVIWSDKTLHIHDNPDNTTLSLYIAPHRLSSHSGQTIWLLHPGTSLLLNYTPAITAFHCNMDM